MQTQILTSFVISTSTRIPHTLFQHSATYFLLNKYGPVFILYKSDSQVFKKYCILQEVMEPFLECCDIWVRH